MFTGNEAVIESSENTVHERIALLGWPEPKTVYDAVQHDVQNIVTVS